MCSAITGYQIQQRTGSTWTDVEDDTGDDATTYAHTGQTLSTGRSYRVRAINSAGGGAWSDVVRIGTPTATAPGAPTNVRVRQSRKTALAVEWSAPTSDGGSAITGYRVQRSADGSDPWTNVYTGTSLRYFDRNLGRGTTRHYRVYAKNTVGEGPASSIHSATTAAVEPPFSPTNGKITAVGRTVMRISWKAVSEIDNGGAPITGYRVDRTANLADYTTVGTTGPTETMYIDRGLSAGTGYRYQLYAVNSAGPSTTPFIVTETTVDASTLTVPGDPTGLTATASGAAAINLAWSVPTDNGGSIITGYQIEVSTDGGSTFTELVASQTATGYSHAGLTVEMTVHYRVGAINGQGPGM